MQNNQRLRRPLKESSADEPADGVETVKLGDDGRPLKPSWWQVHHHWHHFSRRQKLISAAFLLLLAGAVIFGIFASKPATAPDAAKQAAKSNKVPSPLTGVLVKPKSAARPVTGIMIENSQDARPQSGLLEAGVVYEAIAEGGITRFLALYQEARPMYIGPVRSLRPYYIDWLTPFEASIAHVGGSPQALSQIRSHGRDLDQFFNAGSYWRVASRPAPHNVYTSFKKLDALNKSKGYTKSKFTVWLRKEDQPAAKPQARSIDFSISGPDFNVHYTYNRKANNYRRSEGGQSHFSTSSASPKSAKILRPKIVIAIVVPYGIASDGHHSEYRTSGRGRAYIFQDGRVIKATWVKVGRAGQIKFVNKNSSQIKLDAGQTWITAVGTQSDVSWRR